MSRSKGESRCKKTFRDLETQRGTIHSVNGASSSLPIFRFDLHANAFEKPLKRSLARRAIWTSFSLVQDRDCNQNPGDRQLRYSKHEHERELSTKIGSVEPALESRRSRLSVVRRPTRHLPKIELPQRMLGTKDLH